MKWWNRINYKKLEKELKQEFEQQKEEEKEEVKEEVVEEEVVNNFYEEGMEKLKRNEEMWVDCKNYPNYKVSNMGNVLFTKKGLLVKQRQLSNKSVIVLLRKDNRSINCTVSSLVANSFGIPNRNGKRNVYHINEMDNNRLDNLSYEDKYNALFKSGYLKKEGNEKMSEYSDKERIDYELTKPVVTEVKEIWKDVVGYERWYEVSNLGNIRKLERDGSTKLLKAKPTDGTRKGRTVGLRKVDAVKTYQVSHVVADAFGLKPVGSNKTIVYHIDGDWNNDCLSNLTYDKTETEAYIRENEKAQETKEQLRLYIDENKEFLEQAKQMNKEITNRDIYDKLCEILEVLKNANK